MRQISDKEPVLIVRGLKTSFKTRAGEFTVVDGIGFSIFPGEILGMIGESGSGKTVTGLSLISLVPYPGRITGGDIRLKGRPLLHLTEKEKQELRGSRITYIFQDPTTSLNPTKTIGWQIRHILQRKRSGQEILQDGKIVEKLLHDVGILSPERVMNLYPHNLSGGMIQRILIAMALGCSPDLLIADEPTTNLDVIVEAQILRLFLEFRRKAGSAILFISHDIGVIAETCDRVVVLYAGKIMEKGNIVEVLNRPAHPYTLGLLKSSPQLEANAQELYQIKGELPSPWELPRGCRFFPRCETSLRECGETIPETIRISQDHFVACHLFK
ncbi:MAG: ABC transporter ATP-binding protein [Thermodesulfobacteriota bacterium]